MISHLNNDGMSLAKYDEDAAYDDDSMHEWKEAYLLKSSIECILDAKKHNNSILYLKSGESLVVRGTPRDVVAFLNCDPYSPIAIHYNKTGEILTTQDCIRLRDARIQASN